MQSIIGFNDTAKEIYPSLEKGKKCYKALMGLDAPCPPCPVANGICGPRTYLDPIRHIYETVDAVETVLADGSRGHALVFSTVAEGERLAGAIPTGGRIFASAGSHQSALVQVFFRIWCEYGYRTDLGISLGKTV